MAENVLLVEDMEHNLLSVRKICDKGNYMFFILKIVKSEISKQIG